MGVTLGYGGGFVTDKGSCRHNVGTVRHKDGCHRMAEGVGVQVGKIGFSLCSLSPIRFRYCVMLSGFIGPPYSLVNR